MNQTMLSKYLSKIGLSKQPEINIESLTQLHEQQHKTIPFENFDVVNGLSIKISEDDFYEKMVLNQRGGYCFELNGLLLSALKSLGFEARVLLARVHLGDNPTGKGHQLILVTIDRQLWIVDAGFGSQTPRAPLPFEFNKELVTDTQTLRFVDDNVFGAILQIKDGHEWASLYSFDMVHVCAGDIEYGNFYTSTSPKSVFTSNSVAAIRTENGIITLLNNKVKIKENQEIQEIILDDEQSYFSALKTYFGIQVDVPYEKINQYF